ncbi:hypothetical protein ABL78_0637 [Leptomonas seymouri]|uniref:Palmitoyltransferase n=1 Tax=Leptomonas seymouri TaxID=5684 RepID=A0A0N1IMN2_LEPSE|nr:hypothetical protein ABL78_0637 [Leptomonas seymouri]|eukprot:KPI90255.1 hypothetical protein ABL78_0637 [Leptomonas seymouri]
MEPFILASAVEGEACPRQERSTHSPATSSASSTARLRKKKQDEDPIVVPVGPPTASLHSINSKESHQHSKAEGTAAAHPCVTPPPLVAAAAVGGNGVILSSSSPLQNGGDDSNGSDVPSTLQRLIAADHAAATAAVRLSSSPVDVPPSAVPASRYKNIYDGSFHLPPGMTKRALGRMRLLWCCVLTQESWHAFFVAGPILFFAVLFVCVVVPPNEWFSYLFTFVFTVGSLMCLTLSVTLDPGVIPPAPLSQQPSGPATIMVDGKPVECKVCKTCHILRPPRSSHCKFCDVCVEEFDHHCGVLGSCVAKRTFRFFGGFFIITSFLALYVGIRSFVVVMSTDFTNGNEDMHLLGIAAGSVVCIVAAIVGGAMVAPCAGQYVMLGATSATTKETMRREQLESGDLPGCVPVEELHSGNYCKNLLRRFFSSLGRSRIPFDYYV